MKTYFIIFFLAVFASCNNQEKAKSAQTEEVQQDTADANLPPGNIQHERDAVQTEKEEPKDTAKISHSLEGRFVKSEAKDTSGSCSCNCIEVTFEEASSLCIDPDNVVISAKFQQTSETTADIFLVKPENTENLKKDLPWDDFDLDQAIAQLEMQPDGSMKLDWIGFHTDGKLATDYAIYGKKTLEGTYVRE